jgi:hypothetical protein
VLAPLPEPASDASDADESEEEDDEGDDEADDEPDPFYKFDPSGMPEDKQIATCAALVIDWIGVTKSPWTSAEDVWVVCETLCQRANFPIFRKVKELVKEYMEGRMERISMCPFGHTAYYDCTHPKLQAPEYQNKWEEHCRVCKQPRYLPRQQRANGSWMPLLERKVGG